MNTLFRTYFTLFAMLMAVQTMADNSAVTEQIRNRVTETITERYQQVMEDFNSRHLSVNFGNALKLFNQPLCHKTLELDRKEAGWRA